MLVGADESATLDEVMDLSAFFRIAILMRANSMPPIDDSEMAIVI